MKSNLALKNKPKSSLRNKLAFFGAAALLSGLVATFFILYLNIGHVDDAKADGIPVVINGYVRVTGINTGSRTLTTNAGSTSEVPVTGTFTAGSRAIIIQMQGNVIGGNTGNDANFGNLSNIGNVGRYEIVTITAVNRNGGGNIMSIVYENPLANTYNTGGTSTVQLITYPTLDDGSGNYTTTSDIIARDWSSATRTGGIIAFNVPNTLFLIDDINADGAGFRGGAANGGGSGGCNSGLYRTDAGDNYANKGESIYRNTTAERVAARGKIINGGGGGNSHNAGGGGGGNFSVGGDGGPGWQTGGFCTPTAGGLGGIALSNYISSDRVFMGGGGGAGEGNDNGATPGGNGGGIIFIGANRLVTDNSCAGVRISANGDRALNTGEMGSVNDGAGGGGAGGSIVLDINEYVINSLCPLVIQANGGDGGSVADAGTHGGGGGGGMGAVILSVSMPVPNVSIATAPGTGGVNNLAGSSQAAPGGGTDGEGVIDNSNLTLPVELIDFQGRAEGDRVFLSWTTATEINNDYFDVELSRDGRDFTAIGRVEGNGTTNVEQEYDFDHHNQFSGTLYYRLKQVDYDGAFEYSKTIFVDKVNAGQQFIVNVFPNPASGTDVTIQVFSEATGDISIRVFNAGGTAIVGETIAGSDFGDVTYTISASKLSKGVYHIQVSQDEHQASRKLLVN